MIIDTMSIIQKNQLRHVNKIMHVFFHINVQPDFKCNPKKRDILLF